MTSDAARQRWDATYSRPYSPTQMRLLRETLAPALPEDVQATTVWPTWPLERLAAELAVTPGQTFLDVGCGLGEITRWVAQQTGASVVGLDPSPVALAEAEQHAVQHLDAGRWRFVEGTADRIPLDDAAVDAVLAIDSLHFAPDPAAAFTEMARVLRPGGRLAMALPVRISAGPPLELLAAAGLRVRSTEETPDRVARMYAYAQALREHEQVLAREMGTEAARELVSMNLEGNADNVAHFLIVAERAERSG